MLYYIIILYYCILVYYISTINLKVKAKKIFKTKKQLHSTDVIRALMLNKLMQYNRERFGHKKILMMISNV